MLYGWVVAGAWAGDVDTWFGGQATTGLQDVQGTGVGTILSQVEFDARAGSGPVYFRLDLDYHFAPLFFSDTKGYAIWPPAAPIPPEDAFVQLGTKFHLRAGVTNPDFGIQSWDEKENYLPSYSNIWNLTNGQNLGLEPGITFDDGTELFVFGGYDLGYKEPGFGLGAATEQDAWSTFSGAFYLPADKFGMILTANEVYPADWLWLTLELDAGVAGPGVYGGGELIASILPDNAVGGAIRFDQQMMDDDAVRSTGVPMDQTAVSAGLRADPTGALHLALEGKESVPHGGGDPYFTGTFLVSVHSPDEPGDDFAVHDPPEEGEEAE